MEDDRNQEAPATTSDEPTVDNHADGDDDAAEIRYSLTALGEAALAHDPRRGRGERFRGFGPCVAVA